MIHQMKGGEIMSVQKIGGLVLLLLLVVLMAFAFGINVHEHSFGR